MNDKKKKIIRISTVPESLNGFYKYFFKDLQENEGYEVVAVSSPLKELEEIRYREGVKTIAVPMERHISPFKDLVSLYRLIKVFHREKPKMVHSITPKAGLLSMIAAWLTRVPVRLHTFTGLVFPTASGLKQKILILTDKITCACASHITPEGEGVKNDLQKFNITKKPLKVLGYGNIKGIDLNYFNPEDEDTNCKALPIRDNNLFTFIFIGRLVGDKGINELVEAFSRLHKEIPATRLILVGPREENLDPLKPETLTEIQTNNAIIETGSQNDVRPWLLASDALVFPSYREGFPNVVIEAGAMGLPSIVTDINGSREIIIEGENGSIIPSKDIVALYTSMKEMILNEDKRHEMALKARNLVASRYEQSFVRGKLKEFYKELLNS